MHSFWLRDLEVNQIVTIGPITGITNNKMIVSLVAKVL